MDGTLALVWEFADGQVFKVLEARVTLARKPGPSYNV